MGIVGIPRYPRVSCGNGVGHRGNTAEMELEMAVTRTRNSGNTVGME